MRGSVAENPVSVTETPVFVCHIPQRREEKKREEKKRGEKKREEESVCAASPRPVRTHNMW